MNIRKFSKQEFRLKSRRCCLLANNSCVCLRAKKRKQILFIDVVTKQNKQSTFFIVEVFQMQMCRFCWLVLKGSEVGFQPRKNPVECTVITKPQASFKWVPFWQVSNSYYFIMYKKTKENLYLDTAQRNSPVNLIRTLAIFSKLL